MQNKNVRTTLLRLAAGASVMTAIAAGVVMAQPTQRSAPAQPTSVETDTYVLQRVISLETARRVVAAAAAKAKADGAGGAIAVCDPGGHLVLIERLTGTFPAASEVAYRKSRTAAIFRMPTQKFENAVRDGRNSLVSLDGVMTPMEGGIPIVVDGHVIGAVGVSGAHSSQHDVEIAEAGAAAAGN